METFTKNWQYYKFCFYGFLKNLRFFDAFFILFLVEKGLPFTQIGILYAIREIVINVFEIPSGILADTFGRKNSLIGSFCAYIISFYIFFISGTFWMFLIAFVLYGVGDAFRSGTHKGMIMDYLRIHQWSAYKIEYYGRTRSWSQTGSAISSLIAGLIVFYSGSYQHIFLYSILPYALNLFLVLSYPTDLNRAMDQNNQSMRLSFKSTMKSFLASLKRSSTLRIISSAAFHSAYLKAVKDYIQPLLVQVALIIPILLTIDPEKKNGLVIGVIYFFIYLLTSLASKQSPKVASRFRSHLASGSLLIGLVFGILCGLLFVYDLWVLSLLAFVGVYLVENVRKPIMTGLIADEVPGEILTSVLSAQSLLKTILTAILALAFGILADYFGIGKAFILLTVILAVSFLLISLLTSKQLKGKIEESQ